MKAVAVVAILISTNSYAQCPRIQLTAYIDYNTSARIYPSPYDIDPIIRSSYSDLNGFISFGGEIRALFSRSNSLGTTFQIMASRQQTRTIYGYDPNGNYVSVPIYDGFHLTLFEFNGYFNLPLGGEKWRIYLGGGPALYFGKRDYEIGNAKATTTTSTNFGIQVETGVEYKIASSIGFRGEMKFRSPQFNSTAIFKQGSTTYNNLTISLPPLSVARINVNGTDFTLGIFVEI
jgi:opacity protein-like surface antigen